MAHTYLSETRMKKDIILKTDVVKHASINFNTYSIKRYSNENLICVIKKR